MTARNVTVREAELTLTPVPFRQPLKFGGRVVDRTDLLDVRVLVEDGLGNRAVGHGSMPVGHIWAWPTQMLSADETEAAMKAFLTRLAREAEECGVSGHPLDIEEHLRSRHDSLADSVQHQQGISESIPTLARLVAASPLDAAIHDAYGRVHNVNSYHALGAEFMTRDIADYLGDERFRGEYLDQYVNEQPQQWMPLYHLVGALDPLTEDDITERVDDGLPETLPEWIAADGLTHLKVKLAGDDLEWDVERLSRIDAVTEAAQAARGSDAWFYSLDFNEKCESEEYVLEFLSRVEASRPHALGRVQYIEQPTHRDLKSHPENTMHRVAARKPVVIDESLVDAESLRLAVEQGYSGVALKSCKGQSESLLLGALAQKDNLFLCVQDLTCPGYSFLHSASLAARVKTVAAIEGNGRQYCPAPNAAYAERYPGMFQITEGVVATAELDGSGLGFEW